MYKRKSILKTLYTLITITLVYLSTALIAHAACPASVNGCTLYIDADSEVYKDLGTTPATNGEDVEQINDLSGNGFNAVQTNPSSQPTYISNLDGNPALQFGSGDLLTVGGNSDFASSAFTVFVVFQRTGSLGWQAVLNKGDGSAGGASWEIMASTNDNNVSFDTFYGGTNSNGTRYGGSLNTELATGVRVSNTEKYIYRNGIKMVTGSDLGNDINAGQHPLGIGNSGSGNNLLPFVGYVRAVVYYPSALSNTDRESVETFLLNKYSVPGVTVLNNLNFALTTFNHLNSTVGMYMYSTLDGTQFSSPIGVTNPVYIEAHSDNLASSIMYYKGKYWLAYEVDAVPGSNFFSIANSDTYGGPYDHFLDVNVRSGVVGAHFVWNPRWFKDDDGSIHIIVNSGDCGADCFQDSNGQPYILDALDEDLSSWSSPTAVTGTFPSNMIDTFLLTPNQSPNGKYNIWFKNETTKYVEYMSSDSLKSGYTLTQSGDWAGWGSGKEGPILIKIGNTWRVYIDRYGIGGGYAYSDSTDNWSTWSNLSAVNASIVTGTGSILLPSVSVVSPDNNESVSGNSVTLTAKVTDFSDIDSVQFKIDGTNYGSLDSTSPYTTTFDSTALTDGTHTISAIATYDSVQNTQEDTITIQVDNPPINGSISYTNGYTNSDHVNLTVDDGEDEGSGLDISSRVVQRSQATLSNSSCGTYDLFQTITTTGTYPNLVDSTISSGYCYKYTYSISDNNGHQAVYTSSNVVKVDTQSPTTPTNLLTPTPTNHPSQTWSWDSATDLLSGILHYVWQLTTDSQTLNGTTTDTSITTTLLDGLYNLKVKSVDNAGNESLYTDSFSLLVDLTKPNVSNISVVPSSDSVTITWDTNETTTGKVYLDSNLKKSTSSSLSHSVSISNLDTCTTYNLAIKATDVASNSTTKELSFTTSGCTSTSNQDQPDGQDENSASCTINAVDIAIISKEYVDNSAKITFKNEYPNSKYNIEYWTKEDKSDLKSITIQTDDSKDFTYTISDLDTSQNMYFRIRSNEECSGMLWTQVNQVSAVSKNEDNNQIGSNQEIMSTKTNQDKSYLWIYLVGSITVLALLFPLISKKLK